MPRWIIVLTAASVAVALAVPDARAAILGLVRPDPATPTVVSNPVQAPPPPVPEPTRTPLARDDNPTALPEQPQRLGPIELPRSALLPPATLPELFSREEARKVVAREYPALLQRAGIGGRVGLLLWIRPDGWVEFPRVEFTSGFRELDLAALRATRSLRFVPATRLGEEVGTWVSFSIRFEPSASDSPESTPQSGAFHIPISNNPDGEGPSGPRADLQPGEPPAPAPAQDDPRTGRLR